MRAVLLNRVLIGLGLAGLFISGTLSLAKASHQLLPCGIGGGCQAVSDHPSAYWFGLPVAFFGLAGYVALTGLAMLRELTGTTRAKALILPGYLGSLLGFLASAYLMYTAFFVIRETCTWCISSALAMTATLAVYTMLFNAAQEGTVVAAVADDGAPYPRSPEPPRSSGMKALPFLLAGLLLTAGATVAIPAVFGKNAAVTATTIKPTDGLVTDAPHALGPETARVTVVEFADFCCPTCRKLAGMPHTLVDKYPARCASSTATSRSTTSPSTKWPFPPPS